MINALFSVLKSKPSMGYDFKLKLNNGVAWDHLVYGPKNFGDTIVREITQLEPGSNMLISDGKVSINRYFKIEDSFDNQNNVIMRSGFIINKLCKARVKV